MEQFRFTHDGQQVVITPKGKHQDIPGDCYGFSAAVTLPPGNGFPEESERVNQSPHISDGKWTIHFAGERDPQSFGSLIEALDAATAANFKRRQKRVDEEEEGRRRKRELANLNAAALAEVMQLAGSA